MEWTEMVRYQQQIQKGHAGAAARAQIGADGQ